MLAQCFVGLGRPDKRGYRKVKAIEKRSWRELAPAGGRGNGDERRTAESAARSAAGEPLRREMRA